MIPRWWHLSIRGLDYIQRIAHLPDRVDRFAAYWFCSRANENRWRRGGGRYWDAKDERQADGGRGGGLDDAYIRLKLIGIVPPADISYLPASSRGSLR